VLGTGEGVDPAPMDLIEMLGLSHELNETLRDLILLDEGLDPRLLDEIDFGYLDVLKFLQYAENPLESGYFQKVYFDFLDVQGLTGTMIFDLTPEADNVVPEPGAGLLLLAGAVGLSRQRRRRTEAE